MPMKKKTIGCWLSMVYEILVFVLEY